MSIIFVTDTATTDIYTLSLHDALPISQQRISLHNVWPLAWSLDHVGMMARSVSDLEIMLDVMSESPIEQVEDRRTYRIGVIREDRKSTRLNSSHSSISYAVFCLKKKTS